MKYRILSAILILLFISACNGAFEVGLEHSATGTPSQAATSTSYVHIDPPALPPSIGPQPTLVVPGMPQGMVQIFLVAVDDNGQTGIPVGCGDSLVPVQVEIPSTGGALKAALEVLLSVKEQYYGQSGLYNALYQSDLQVESVSIDSGKATVNLTGTLLMGGECDIPRVQAQLEFTVLQFSTLTEADIFNNGIPLADALSLKG
jgi:hypothetical protein